MALSDTISLTIEPNGPAISVPGSATSKWTEIISAGGPTSADTARIVNPTTAITADTRRIFRRGGLGTFLVFRLKYNGSITSVTSPKIAVFGRTGSAEQWQRLSAKSGADSATLTVSTSNDSGDGTMKYTTVVPADHTFDCQGCEEFLVGVETALAATGTVNTSTIEAKIY
jgi:hypothetical protein